MKNVSELQKLRLMQGLTLKEAGKAMGVHAMTIATWEKQGYVTPIRINVYAKVLKCPKKKLWEMWEHVKLARIKNGENVNSARGEK